MMLLGDLFKRHGSFTSYYGILFISIFFSFFGNPVSSDFPHHNRTALTSSTNQICKRLFYCGTGRAGFGDQIEHYFFCIYIAKLLRIHDSDFIVHGFYNANNRHPGMSEYPLVAAFLGIDVVKNNDSLKDLQHISVNVSEAEILHERLRTNKTFDLPCSVYYSSDINSCGKWCFSYNDFKGKKYVRGYLQRKGIAVKSKCANEGHHNHDVDVIQIVWHVRQGDICLHCKKNYHNELYKQLLPSLQKRNIPWNITFESQGDLTFLKRDPIFKKSYFINRSSLRSTICRFLTSNILITSGSSLPVVTVAYSELWNPIVIEEHLKEGRNVHYFTPEEAVLVDEGNMTISEQEFYKILMTNTQYLNEY